MFDKPETILYMKGIKQRIGNLRVVARNDALFYLKVSLIVAFS